MLKLMISTSIDTKRQIWLKKSEANFPQYFVWQLFKIVTNYIDNDTLCLEIGESSKNQIERRGDSMLKLCSYNADGWHTTIIGGKIVELSIVEITGPFGFSGLGRSTEDHVKGSFGTLSLLHQIGHLFHYGSIDTFQKVHVFFIQTLCKGRRFLRYDDAKTLAYLECQIWLGSLEQVLVGVCIMELLETATIPTSFEQCEINIRDIVNSMFMYKTGLERSIATIEALRAEHNDVDLKIARRILSLVLAPSLVISIDKSCVLKIKREYISGYQDLQVSIL